MTDHTTTTSTAEAPTPDAHRSGARRLSANDVLGIPALPPGAVARGGTRMRAGVARVADVFAMPPVRILEGIFGLLDHRVLVALCEAGVPEALDRPTDINELAEQLAVDPDRLARLLRYAVAKRWLRTDRRGRIVPTAFTRFLHRDHPGGWRAWVEFAAGDEVLRAVGALSANAGDTDTFEAANGSPFFEWMADHPDRWRVFDQAMAAGGRMHGLALASTLRWKGHARICDVGGGTGDLLAVLLDRLPSATGAVYDLPSVVARAVEHERLSAVAGDAFSAVPSGFDTYLLVNVLHDWSDADSTKILGNVADAMGATGRVVVVDSEQQRIPRDTLGVGADVLMAALTSGGRERSVEDFERLGQACGLRLVKAHRLVSGDRAYELRP
jgi:SAM-dependent methyltransferase